MDERELIGDSLLVCFVQEVPTYGESSSDKIILKIRLPISS